MAWFKCIADNQVDGVKFYKQGEYYEFASNPSATYFSTASDALIATLRDDNASMPASVDKAGAYHMEKDVKSDELTLASGATVTAIKDEDDLASDSATSLATQQSIKAYVDSERDYSGLSVDANATVTTIPLVDSYVKFTLFDSVQAESISSGNATTDQITIGASSDYEVVFYAAGGSASTNKVHECDIFSIAAGTSVITGITQATPAVVTAVAHGFSDGDKVKISGVVGMTEVNDRIFTVANKADDTFELTDDEGVDIASGGFTAYSSDGVAQLATETGAHVTRKFASSDIGAFSGGALVALTANDALEWYIKGTTDASNLTIESCSMYLHRIG